MGGRRTGAGKCAHTISLRRSACCADLSCAIFARHYRLCGRSIGENGEAHYTELGGCPGNQFTEGSEFAMWTVLPCLRWPFWSEVVRIPYYLLQFILGTIMFILILVGLLVSFVMVPLTGPIACCVECWQEDPDGSYMIITLPMYAVVLLIMSLTVFLLETVWLPVAYALVLFALPLRLYFRREGESLCEALCDLYSFTDNGQPNVFWCPPIVAFMSLVDYVGSD